MSIANIKELIFLSYYVFLISLAAFSSAYFLTKKMGNVNVDLWSHVKRANMQAIRKNVHLLIKMWITSWYKYQAQCCAADNHNLEKPAHHPSTWATTHNQYQASHLGIDRSWDRISSTTSAILFSEQISISSSIS